MSCAHAHEHLLFFEINISSFFYLFLAKPTTVQINKAPPMDLPWYVEHPQGKLLTDGDQAVIECEVKGNTCAKLFVLITVIIIKNLD